MLDYIIKICEEKKLKVVYTLTLPDNYKAINLLKKKGFTLKYHTDSVITGILDLKEDKTKLNTDQSLNNPKLINKKSQVKRIERWT